MAAATRFGACLDSGSSIVPWETALLWLDPRSLTRTAQTCRTLRDAAKASPAWYPLPAFLRARVDTIRARHQFSARAADASRLRRGTRAVYATARWFFALRAISWFVQYGLVTLAPFHAVFTVLLLYFVRTCWAPSLSAEVVLAPLAVLPLVPILSILLNLCAQLLDASAMRVFSAASELITSGRHVAHLSLFTGTLQDMGVAPISSVVSLWVEHFNEMGTMKLSFRRGALAISLCFLSASIIFIPSGAAAYDVLVRA
jgi:hypothetical protein